MSNQHHQGPGPTAIEQKHTPVLSLEGPMKSGESTNVTVKVGSIPHPNENEHFIQWVTLYAGKIFLARFDFTAMMTESEVTIPIRLYHQGTRCVPSPVVIFMVYGKLRWM